MCAIHQRSRSSLLVLHLFAGDYRLAHAAFISHPPATAATRLSTGAAMQDELSAPGSEATERMPSTTEMLE